LEGKVENSKIVVGKHSEGPTGLKVLESSIRNGPRDKQW